MKDEIKWLWKEHKDVAIMMLFYSIVFLSIFTALIAYFI